MPSPTAATALIRLWEHNEAPWNWPTWQDHTGITKGLFPPQDCDLPFDWTRHQADDIKTYFMKFKQLPSEESRAKFARGMGGEVIVGRELWKACVVKQWRRWNLNGKIIEALREEKLHPVSLMIADNNLDSWPYGDTWIPIVLDAVAEKLFGEECLDPASGRLPTVYRQPVQIMVQRTWEAIRKQFQREKKNMALYESQAVAAFQGMAISAHSF
jgi:hypothetical protein